MSYKDIITALEEEKQFIIPRLQKNTFTLIQLVTDDKIESFSFSVNNFTRELKNHFFVSVQLKNSGENITLGVFEHLKDFPKAKKNINDSDTFNKLKDINEYIYFANQHMATHLPAIKEQTYYSINAVNKLGGFKNNKVTLLPDFMDEELQPMKNSKSQKTTP